VECRQRSILPGVPSADFWLDWTLAAPVARLRELLPAILTPAGYVLEETQTAASGPGWAAFLLRLPGPAAEPIGSARAQDVGEGRSQMFVGPGSARDGEALAELNRAALLLYVELVRGGLLAPPPPLETPSRPLNPPAG
jgi:hypothetical protein